MFRRLISKIGRVLSTNKIPYMIIGGHAVILYGEPRFTRDIDITLGVGNERLQDILSIINQISLQILPENIDSFVKKTMVLPAMDKNTGIRVDFIFSFTTYEREAIKRAKKILIGKTRVSYASVEDVIIHKVFAHRPQDIEDVKNILLKNSKIDKDYIIKWLKEFDRSFPKQKFAGMFRKINNCC
ncbi:MAG: nucleotidyl transferase AbiEii/AbiGii toxin family protein [bacterium]